MSDLHKERHFEAEICQSLANHGWLHAEGDAALYDRTHALFLPDLLTWLETTQPDAWQQLTKTYGAARDERLAERIRKSLNERGTLEVLRRGVEMQGTRAPLSLMQPKPSQAHNPDIGQRYRANRLRVVQQIHHSPNNPHDALDLVLFVNGIAVATAELKSDFTQSVEDAVEQYRADRHPQPRGGQPEPLLSFPGGALVHFAVSHSEVRMTTKLEGARTHFLPFNKGNHGTAGNAPNPNGFATAYLWEEVWARESWLNILHRYLIGRRNDRKQLTALIFPRYHQLDVTRNYVAFTATPKQKTLELFGRPGTDGLPQPFHVYSMRQAIEEGFILDVLKNYTTYKLAFRLADENREYDDQEVERAAARKSIMQWVRLHPYNIAQKVQIVVEHYRENMQSLLEGKARAMVVVTSRKEAVRWQKAMREYIERQGYPLGVLVAFSGEVNDPDSYAQAVSETDKALNPGLKGRDIRKAFDTPDYHLLIVASKFQTGFDQPLLCGMYVDRILDGIQAVQTLSRLNRAYPGKDTTYILDFVNEADKILTAFRAYYETAQIETATDPNLIFDLRAKLDASGYYDDAEVARVVNVELDPKGTQAQLLRAIAPVAEQLLALFNRARQHRDLAVAQRHDSAAEQAARDQLDALRLFRSDMGAFVRLYAFMCQIFNYGVNIEKRFLFYRQLVPLLEFERERETIDLSKITLTHHHLKNHGSQNLNLPAADTMKLSPIHAVGSGLVQDKEKMRLDEIIQKLNDLFEGELTDDDRLMYVNGVIKGKLLENERLIQQSADNSKEQFGNSPDIDDALMNAIISALDSHMTMSRQALDSERVRNGLKGILPGPGQLYEALHAKARTLRGHAPA
jgi:type I site-specific restriction-modification system R (restriction) subunit